jgi:hypothetical protein
MIDSLLAKGLPNLGAQGIALVLDAEPQSELCHIGDIDKIAVVNGHLEDFLTISRAINVGETDTLFRWGHGLSLARRYGPGMFSELAPNT